MAYKVAIWQNPPRPMTSDITACCRVAPVELGRTAHGRISQMRLWIQCPKCERIGWMGDPGYVPDPSLKLIMPWEPGGSEYQEPAKSGGFS